MKPDIRPNIKAHLARNAALGLKPGTMRELAAALGVRAPGLSRFLGGQSSPAGVTLEQVAEALGVSVDAAVWLGRR